MIRRLQQLPPGVRIVVFSFIVVGSILLLVGITVGLLMLSVNSTPRQTAISLRDDITVSEYAALPDNDAFPSTVTTGADGTVYAASYISGAVWRVTPDGTVAEIPNTRDTFVSVTGLTAHAGGALLAIAFTGGDDGTWAVHRIAPDGRISPFATITDEEGFVSPFDLTVDPDGRVYVVDRTRAEVWRWNADGSDGVLWFAFDTGPTSDSTTFTAPAPTGIAYDPVRDALLVADPDANTLVRIARADASAELVFHYAITGNATFPPGFDGLAVAPDGRIYATALDQKGVVTFAGSEPYVVEDLVYIAGNFRGPSDLALLPDGRLVVTNFDSVSLVQPGVTPQLPFGLDVIEIRGEQAE